MHPVFDLSKMQWGGLSAEGAKIEAPKSPWARVRGRSVPSPPGERPGIYLCPFLENVWFFHFKIMHSGAFSYKFYFLLNAGKSTTSRYSWRLTVIQTWKRQVFINLVNLFQSSQSVATRVGFTATVGMCYRPEIILYELQTQAAL